MEEIKYPKDCEHYILGSCIRARNVSGAMPPAINSREGACMAEVRGCNGYRKRINSLEILPDIKPEKSKSDSSN